MNALAMVTFPPGAVTDKFTTPTEAAGVIAVMEDSESTTNERAATPPKVTAVAPHRFAPVITTAVLPLVGPLVGLISISAGASP